MRNFYNCRLPLLFLVSLFSILSFSASAQQGSPCDAATNYLYWTGEVNNDFFNEGNWRIATEDNSGTSCNASSPYLYKICPSIPNLANDPHPDANTLEPGVEINFNLYIQSSTVVANGNIAFACAQKGITLVGSTLTITNGTVTKGILSLTNESTVYLQQGTISASLSLNFLDAASWVYINQDNPQNLLAKAGNIFVNDVAGTLDNNFRINQYYQKGSVVRPLSNSFAAAKIYSGTNLQGTSADVNEDIIYSGTSVPNGMNNNIGSFKLKRGFMATIAVNDNGTGKSRVYIASESDLTVNTLDVALQGNVSFIRVVPWNWVTKKGTGFYYDLDAGWYYNWNLNGNPQPNTDYVPMAWGASGAFPSAISQMIAKKKTTHVLGFNESDNCADQSGQYNNLCQPAVAVAYYENLMSLGVRLGSPAPREEGPSGWLKDFNTIAKAKDVRFDFVAVHWYDWGSNPASTPNATPQEIFNRFKSYLQNVYNIYKLPIWITEFNANPNRPKSTNESFLSLAMPFLDTLSYVERYAFFQPSGHVADYFDANGNITSTGILYKNNQSTPSMPGATYVCANNLDGLNLPYTSPTVNTTAFEAECGKYVGNQWVVTTDTTASNSLYIKGDATLAGATTLAKQTHFEFETAVAGSYRVYIRSISTGTGSIKMGMDSTTPELMSPFTSASYTWFEIPRFYDLGTGLHRLTVEFPNSNIMLDQIVITNGQQNLDALIKNAGYCTPSTVKFGLDTTNILSFYEAENAAFGSNWSAQTSTNAVGGAYLKSADNITSAQPPTGTDKQITFTFNIAKADEYELWAKIKAINSGENSLWIAVDDEPYRKWDHLGTTIYEWYWKKFYYSYGSEDRSFTYFLAAGQHTVKIAIAGGNVHVDRFAVATKGKTPSDTDPNVLLLAENLEFEAETATFLGTITTQTCANSSNGIQVNMGTAAANGVRFSSIVAATAGTYKLKVSYMSKDTRNFKVIVNGTTMGRQTPPPSGNWCFIDATNPTLGSPAIYEVVVNLNRGLNTIDIKPWGTIISGSSLPNSPFIDKIKLEKASLTNVNLEAELAEIVGSTSIVTCNTASNGALASLPLGTANGIRYNNILCSEAKTYDVDISYISKVARNLRISVNGGAYVTYSFDPSGNWCFEGGSPTIKTISLALAQGVNTIDMRATTADAPFLDKIVIKEQPISNVTFTTSGLPAGATSVNVNYKYYTNPTTLSAALSAATDFTVPVATNNGIYFSYPSTITIPGGNVYSVFGVSTSGGTISASSQSGYNNQLIPTQPRTITGAYQLSCAVPSITMQPINQVKTYGDNAHLALVAAGTAITYQWQVNTGSGFVNITSSTNNPGNIYTGFNSAQLDIASLVVYMSGYQYKCVITNSCGTISANTVSLTVNPAVVSITANNKSKTYGEDNPTLDATVSGLINGDVLNYSLATTAVKFSTVNNYPITVSSDLNPNYSIIVNNGSLTINARNATITANNQFRIYGDDNPIFDATIGGTVNGDILNYSLSTTAMKFSDVGNYPISVTVGSNANYNIVTENGSLQVGKRNGTITANNQTKTYGDDNPILDATITGTVNGDILDYLLSTTALKFSDIGNYPISVSLGSNANYNIVTENGSLQVGTRNATVKANNQSKTYGDDNPILDATISGTVNGDILNYSLSTTALKFSDIGNYPISVSLGSNANYNIVTENGNLQVGTRNATVKVNNQSKTYGDDNPILDATICGTVNGDILNYSLSTTALKFSDIGNYPISVSLGSNANYNIVTENGNLQVGTRNATVKVNNQSKTYGDDNPILDATISGTVNGDILNYSLSTTALKFSDIGNYPISVSLGSNDNYNIVTENGSLQVGKRNATITANNQTKTYGDDNPILDATISGTVNGDILDYSLSTTALKFSDIGNYPISVSLGSNANYNIVTENGSLHVDPRTPLISCPTNITVNAENHKCGASVNFAATETQAYPAATIAYTENGNAVSSGAFFATGVHTITATATNVAGSSTCSFTIEVKDMEKPLITVPANVTIACSAPTSPSALGTATATDNCSATVSYSDAASCNLITRTWTATDPSGNSVSGVQVITIQPLSASITSVPTNTVYTGGNPNNLYLGYGAQSSTLQLGSLPFLGAPYTYSWSGAGTNMLSSTAVPSPVFTPTTGGYYTFTVTVKNKYGCTATATISICVTDIRVVGSNGAGKVYLCHVTNGNPANRQTLSVSVNAVDAHLTQHPGDRLGSCDQSPCASSMVASSSGNSTATTATKKVNEVVATSEEDLKVTVMPNPSTNYFTLKLESKYDQPVNLRVMDESGKVVDARSKLGSNSTLQIGQNYSSGTYYAELIQGNRRKIVQLLKIK